MVLHGLLEVDFELFLQNCSASIMHHLPYRRLRVALSANIASACWICCWMKEWPGFLPMPRTQVSCVVAWLARRSRDRLLRRMLHQAAGEEKKRFTLDARGLCLIFIPENLIGAVRNHLFEQCCLLICVPPPNKYLFKFRFQHAVPPTRRNYTCTHGFSLETFERFFFGWRVCSTCSVCSACSEWVSACCLR